MENIPINISTQELQEFISQNLAPNGLIKNKKIFEYFLNLLNTDWSTSTVEGCETKFKLIWENLDKQQYKEYLQNEFNFLLMKSSEINSKILEQFLKTDVALFDKTKEGGKNLLHIFVQKSNINQNNYLYFMEKIKESLPHKEYIECINQTDSLGMTPFMWALRHKKEDLALDLLERGCNTSAVSKNKNSSLHLAITHSEKIASLLIDRGENVSLKDKDKNTGLMLAAKHNPSLIPKILSSPTYNGLINESRYEGGPTALMISIQNNPSNIQYLLSAGACLNNGKYSALNEAVEHNPSLIPLLIKHGAKINEFGGDGDFPLVTAVFSNKPHALKTLDDLITVYGADIHLKNPHSGATVLMSASVSLSKYKIECMKKLLKHGARLEDTDFEGNNTFLYSLNIDWEDKNFEAIQFLADNGADIHAKNKRGHDALYFIIKNGAPLEFLEWIIEKNILTPDNKEDAYFWALKYKSSLEVFKVLFNAGVVVDPEIDYGSFLKDPTHEKASEIYALIEKKIIDEQMKKEGKVVLTSKLKIL